VPPLRERVEDVPLLIDHFNRRSPKLTEEAKSV
jgi:DNA-binding NtrC family response regulator